MDTNIRVPLENGKVDNQKNKRIMLIETCGELIYIDELSGRCTPILANVNIMKFTMMH